jgi:hypothetical protein
MTEPNIQSHEAIRIDLQIPKDGYHHKYIYGITQSGKEIIAARPIKSHHRHYMIVDELHDATDPFQKITGGYVRQNRDVFHFTGRSFDYGRADHKRVSSLVNGSSLRTKVKLVKSNLELKLHDEIADLKYSDLYSDGGALGEVVGKASTTALFGSLCLLSVNHALRGYHGLPFIDASDDVAISYGAYMVGNTLNSLTNSYMRRNGERVEAFVGNTVVAPIFGAIAYGAGCVAREILDN